MAVYREAYHVIEAIETQSTRIYPDAADYGALVKKGDQLWKDVQMIMDWHGNKETRESYPIVYGWVLSQNIEVIEEWQTGNEEHYKITYHHFTKGLVSHGGNFDGFIEIEKVKVIKNKRQYQDY